MARKGSRKVRTGCHTCKARKVKCDEGKPVCERCTSTGRKCEGYTIKAEPSLTSFRFNRLFQSIERPVEGRALQFFCETAAKSLSGHLDSYFWTHLVLQFSNFEPAVRHSLLSISSLYEDLHCKSKSVTQLNANTFALRHYNAAIKRLMDLNNEPVILLVCILFVCIEVMQGNIHAAMQHSTHGLAILEQIGTEYPWAIEHLQPIFRRLIVSPLIFGHSTRALPEQGVLDAPIPRKFTSLSEAQSCMDAIVSQGSYLTRLSSAYHDGKHISSKVDPELLAQQRDLLQRMKDWHTCFCDFFERQNLPQILSKVGDAAYYNLMVRYRLTRLWIEAAFVKEQSYWDDYIDDLKAAINQAIEINPAASVRPQFTFEVGYLPFVFFAIRRCRDLETRLRGLRWVRSCGSARENMWDAAHMYSICRRLIEIEHDVILDDNDWPIGDLSWDALPAEESRPKSFFTSPDIIMGKNSNGEEVWGSFVVFLMQTADGEMWMRKEFLPCLTPMTSDRQRAFTL